MDQYQDTGLIFAGNIYMSEIVDGVPGEFAGPINVSRLEMTPPQPESVNRTSYQRDTYGQVLDSVNLPGEAPRMAMDFDSLPSGLLADALAGTSEAYSATVQTVTGEAVTLKQGLWKKLPYPNVDENTISVTLDSDGTTELVRGTDYDVEPVSGLIRALNETGAVAVTVDFDTLQASGQRILGATEISKSRQIIMDGVNLVTGKKAHVTIHSASFSATQALDLMAREMITGTLEGTMTTPSGKTSPYEALMYD
ncbi:MAG: hypothetical protein HLX50_09050 [Alteromonadaceae bacterium]|nr:hypothetical protein [Alteromonadaceae bacterium]